MFRTLMNRLGRLVAALVALFAMNLGSGPAEAQSNYRIKSGDQLTIEVLEDSSLNRSVLVLPGGSFDFPLVGTQQAGGLTVGQVRQNLTTALAPNFAVSPTVFVSIAGLAAPREPREPDTIATYVTGEVNNPGKLEVEPGTTILQILAQAGGLTPFAAQKRIQLRRIDPTSGLIETFLFSYSGKGRGQRIPGSTQLFEGDVVVVPERRLFE